MTHRDHIAGQGLPRLAEDVVLTPLPFGGAVLVNGVTLALAELREREFGLFERLLTTGFTTDAEAPVRDICRQLVSAGWLVFPDTTARH